MKALSLLGAVLALAVLHPAAACTIDASLTLKSAFDDATGVVPRRVKCARQ